MKKFLPLSLVFGFAFLAPAQSAFACSDYFLMRFATGASKCQRPYYSYRVIETESYESQVERKHQLELQQQRQRIQALSEELERTKAKEKAQADAWAKAAAEERANAEAQERRRIAQAEIAAKSWESTQVDPISPPDHVPTNGPTIANIELPSLNKTISFRYASITGLPIQARYLMDAHDRIWDRAYPNGAPIPKDLSPADQQRISDIRTMLRYFSGAYAQDAKPLILSTLQELVKPGDSWMVPILKYMRTYYLNSVEISIVSKIEEKSLSQNVSVPDGIVSAPGVNVAATPATPPTSLGYEDAGNELQGAGK